MDFNNLDLITITTKAASAVEELLSKPPYTDYDEANLEKARSTLTTQLTQVLISDHRELQKQQRDASRLPAPPPYDPAVAALLDQQNKVLENLQVRTTAPECTLNTIEDKGLSLRQQRDFTTTARPLGAEGKMPARQKLTVFWRRAERAIKGLGGSIQAADLERAHLGIIGPLLVGDTAWGLLENQSFDDWDEFKQVVEKRFGLSTKQVLDAFYNMRPEADESEASFLLRVEDMRLECNQGPEICHRSFLPQLSLEYRRELKQLARARLVADLTWEEVIEDARRTNEYSSLTPEDATNKLQGFGRPQIEQPVDNVVAVVSTPTVAGARKGKGHKQLMVHDHQFAVQEEKENEPPRPSTPVNTKPAYSSSGGWQSKTCSLCQLLGRSNNRGHTVEECYANPQSANARPSIIKMRWAEIKRKNLEMPECFREYDATHRKQGPPNKLDKALVMQMDEDFQALMADDPGRDPIAAYKDACASNLGHLIEDDGEEHVFFSSEDNTDIQASTHSQQEEVIKRHLMALQQFNEDDLVAAQKALEGEQEDQEMTIDAGVGDGDVSSSESDDDTDDNLPLSQWNKRKSAEASSSMLPPQVRSTHSTAIQTGGVMSAGRLVRGGKKKKEETLGNQVSKLRILLPLFKGMAIKENLRHLVLNQAVVQTHQSGGVLRVVKGTAIKEVSAEQLAEEAQAYADHTVDDHAGVQKALKKIRKKYSKNKDRMHLINEIVDKIKIVLDDPGDEQQGRSDAVVDDPDQVYFVNGKERQQVRLPAGARGVPDWAPKNVKNLRGLIPTSKAHYLGLVNINGNLTEVMLDTAGSRTMIDVDSAKALGLEVDWADDKAALGTFSGVGGAAMKYAGIARGPITLQFSEEVTMQLDEIKVFNHPEPIILFGTDLLGHALRAQITFCYLGVNPVTEVGEIIFYNQDRKLYIACELVHAPASHTSSHVIPVARTKRVSFANPPVKGVKAQQGQRL